MAFRKCQFVDYFIESKGKSTYRIYLKLEELG